MGRPSLRERLARVRQEPGLSLVDRLLAIGVMNLAACPTAIAKIWAVSTLGGCAPAHRRTAS
jgi:hypothetical protein